MRSMIDLLSQPINKREPKDNSIDIVRSMIDLSSHSFNKKSQTDKKNLKIVL